MSPSPRFQAMRIFLPPFLAVRFNIPSNGLGNKLRKIALSMKLTRKHPFRFCDHFFYTDLFHASEINGTYPLETRGAMDPFINHRIGFAVRTRQRTICRAKKGNERRIESCSDMHGAAIVCNEKIAILNQTSQFPKRGNTG